MRGHVRKRSRGSWEITIDVGRDPSTGKRRQHFETVRGAKKQAEQRLAELQTSIGRGTYTKPERITIGEWLQRWLHGYVDANCSPTTRESYTDEIRRHINPALGSMPLHHLRTHHIQAYLDEELREGRKDGGGGLSPRTVQYHKSILGRAMDHATRMGLMPTNPVRGSIAPRPKGIGASVPALELDDIEHLLDTIRESPYYLHFYTLFCTGLRRGELLGLRWRDIDLDLAQIHVTQSLQRLDSGEYIIKEPKTSRSRRAVDLPPSLCILLRQHRENRETQRLVLGKLLTGDDLVFADAEGGVMYPGTLSHVFKTIVAQAGLPPMRLHDLRHLHATVMLKQGVHPKIVSERLGHASIAITLDTYSHVVPGLQKAAAEQFDTLFRGEKQKNVGKMLATQHKVDMSRVGLEPTTP